MDLALRLREQHGISVRTEWLDSILAQMRAANGDATVASWPEAQVFEHVFTAFLFCDLNQSGAEALPPDAKSLHKQVLKGRYVLQVDEVVNAAAAAKERYTGEGGSRCLKLALTDGCQQVVAVEYSPLPSLAWDCPAGSKLLLHDVPVRRGLLLLGPGNAVLLGGQVERMEAARQRAVAAWNKPVVGRPPGAGPRDIFGEARRAAWEPGNQQQQQQGQQGRVERQPLRQDHQGAAAAHGVPGGPPAAAPAPAPPAAARAAPGPGAEGAVGARQWSLGGGAGVGAGAANGHMQRPQQGAQQQPQGPLQQHQQQQQQAPVQLQGPPVPPLPGEAGAPSSSGWLGRGAAQPPHAAPPAQQQPAHAPPQPLQRHLLHGHDQQLPQQHQIHQHHNGHTHQRHQAHTQRTQPTQPVQQTPLTVPRPALARPALPPAGTAAVAPSASGPVAVGSALPPARVGVSATAAGGVRSGGEEHLGGASGAAGTVHRHGAHGVPGGPPVYDLISSSSSEDDGDGGPVGKARSGVVARPAGPAPSRSAGAVGATAAAARAPSARRAACGLADSDDSASEGGWEQERAGGAAGARAVPGAQCPAMPGNVGQHVGHQDGASDDVAGAGGDAVEGGGTGARAEGAGAPAGAQSGAGAPPSSSRLKRTGGPLPPAAPGAPVTGNASGPTGLDSSGRGKRHAVAGLPPSVASSPVSHTSMMSMVTGVTPAGTPATAAAAAAARAPAGDVGGGSAGGSGNTLSGSRKPCLRLARSSPRPIFAPLSSGAAAARTSGQPFALAQADPPSSSAAAAAPAAAAVGPSVLASGICPSEGSGGPSRGRAGGGRSVGALLYDADEVMDLAALDDEAGHVPYEHGGEHYGPSPGTGADADGGWGMEAGGSGGGGACGVGSGRRLQGGSGGGRTRALEPPLEPPGGDEKRQRLGRSGPGSGPGLGGFPAGGVAPLDGGLEGEGIVGVVLETQLDVGELMEEGQDTAGSAGCGLTRTWAKQLVEAAPTHPPHRRALSPIPAHQQLAYLPGAGPSGSHAQPQHHHTPSGDSFAAFPGHVPLPSTYPRAPSPGRPLQPAAYAPDTNQLDPQPQPHHGLQPQPHMGVEPQPEPEHVGLLLLCQVRELVACTDINTRGAGGSQGAGGGLCFPLRVDVCGVFHSLQGDEVEIEDGTALVAARVGEALGEPLVRAAAAMSAATGTPPPGTARPEDLTLDAVYDMVGHDDPAVRQYGEGLANHLMEFVRTFSGAITLQYDGPNVLPTILRLVPDDDSDEDDLHGSAQQGAVSQGLAAAQLPYMVPYGQGSGGGRTTLYERCLRELQVLGPVGEDV